METTNRDPISILITLFCALLFLSNFLVAEEKTELKEAYFKNIAINTKMNYKGYEFIENDNDREGTAYFTIKKGTKVIYQTSNAFFTNGEDQKCYTLFEFKTNKNVFYLLENYVDAKDPTNGYIIFSIKNDKVVQYFDSDTYYLLGYLDFLTKNKEILISDYSIPFIDINTEDDLQLERVRINFVFKYDEKTDKFIPVYKTTPDWRHIFNDSDVLYNAGELLFNCYKDKAFKYLSKHYTGSDKESVIKQIRVLVEKNPYLVNCPR